MRWDRTTDVVVIGSGAAGFPAAIAAREGGSEVLLLEAEPHVGGHAICSGGNMPLGGGSSFQKKYGIADTPDLLFSDLTDWSVVESNGAPDYRYNDREIVRAFADQSAATFEFLLKHGVVFVDKAPDERGGMAVGNSVPREHHVAIMEWTSVRTGRQADPSERLTKSSGDGLIPPLAAAAQKLGVTIALEHRLVGIVRESPRSGRVVGVLVEHAGKHDRVQARKAVIVATGGSASNVNFRRMFDPRLTEEYCGVAGEPYSKQDASGELAAMEVGAALLGTANQTLEVGSAITKPGSIGTQFGYVNLQWLPGSPVFAKARATGLRVKDWQDVIMVNMIGKRFYDETGKQFSTNNVGDIDPYTAHHHHNAKHVKYDPNNWINAAMAGIGDGKNGGGPIWAVFDEAAVARESWTTQPPWVDAEGGFFFAANTLEDLARRIVMRHQRVPMPPEALVATVERYNGFVESGQDDDFGKSKPRYKIERPPFYAAWATPVPHDTLTGLRINASCQVVDWTGAIIPGLYSCGESAGGFNMHGLARATCQGRIAGLHATLAKSA